MRYYKATRPDGTDFQTGTVLYEVGKITRHPNSEKMVKDKPETYLSASIAPDDCTGFKWPCRLFEVKPVGRTIKSSNLPNKRCALAWEVVSELPAWQAFGPNGQEVVKIIDRVKTLTPEEIQKLAASRWAAGSASRWAAWSAVRSASRWAARSVARWAVQPAEDAALAVLTRDIITPEQFEILYAPWREVIGE